jgi:nitrite reductase (NADH) small subunit
LILGWGWPWVCFSMNFSICRSTSLDVLSRSGERDALTWRVEEYFVAQWVRLCGLSEAPAVDSVMEVEAEGVAICFARVNGELSALGNVCPHRQGPLGQGWVEGGAVVCPWHSWMFDVKTGVAAAPDRGRVEVFPLRIVGDDVLVALEQEESRVEHLSDEENI